MGMNRVLTANQALGRLTVLAGFLVVILQASTAASFQADEYYTVTEYIASHSNQAQILEAFRDRVSRKAQPAAVADVIKVAVVFPGDQISDYWRRSIKSFKRRLDEYAVKYTVSDFFMKPGNELRSQAMILETALKNNPDYLIFTLDAKRHQRMIERVLNAGRPKVILQNITTPLKKWEDRQPFLYDGFDHVEGTQMLARTYIEATGGEGGYVMVLPKPGYLSQMRGNEFSAYISSHSNLHLKALYHIEIDKEAAFKAAHDALAEFPEVSFVYASTTDIAMGVIEAIDELGLSGRVMVNGWGGGASELDAVLQGQMNFTVMRMNDDNGVAMADAIVLDAMGKGSQVPAVFSGDFVLVQKGISEQKLEQLKQRAFRYSE